MSDEVIIAIIGGITTLGGAIVRYIVLRLREIDQRNQRDLDAERKGRQSDQRRIADLEAQQSIQTTNLTRATGRIGELEDEQSTLIAQVKDLQTRLSATEKKLEAKEQEAETLRRERDELHDQCRAHQRDIERLKAEVKAYQTALSLVGERLEKRIATDDQSASAQKVRDESTDTGAGESPAQPVEQEAKQES